MSRLLDKIQAEMAESEAIQTAVTQVAIQAATVAVVLREADTGPTSGAIMANAGEACRQKHGRPALKQPLFNEKAPGKYAELLSFEMKVTNILQTRTYKLNDERESPYHKNVLGRKELQLIQSFTSSEKRHARQQKDCFNAR